MSVALYTANGSLEGDELNDAFWGTVHVSKAITRMKNTNPLIGIDIFQSFPVLKLSQSSLSGTICMRKEEEKYNKREPI